MPQGARPERSGTYRQPMIDITDPRVQDLASTLTDIFEEQARWLSRQGLSAKDVSLAINLATEFALTHYEG